MDPNITLESLRSFFMVCATIGIVLSIFPILGGVLSLKKKLWGVSLGCAIIGLFTFLPIIFPGILCLIALILIMLSKEEFE